jgi:ABC-type multidrug transport system fused ATPase/permease subunit
MSASSHIHKLAVLLTAADRRQLGWLSLALFVSSLLEAFGIGLIFPIVLAALSPERLVAVFPAAVSLLGPLAASDARGALLIPLLGLLLAFFLTKNIFITAISYWRSKFVFDCRTHVSQRLFQTYLRQPYTFHLQRNTAELAHNISQETITFAFEVLAPTVFLLSETLVAIAVLGVLFMIQPAGTLIVVALFGVAALLAHFSLHETLARWGKARQHHVMMRILHMQQALQGIKEIKAYGREERFTARFDEHDAAVSRYYRKQDFLAQLPRVWLELFAVVGILGIVWVLDQQAALDDLLPTLGIFVGAAFRMFPSVNRIFSAMQLLKLGQATVDTLHRELTTLEPSSEVAPLGPATPLRLAHEIHFEDVAFRYPNTLRDALHGLTFAIPRGSFVAITGSSGSGKSTLLDLLLGLLAPSTGRILADGCDIRHNVRAWQAGIGYVAQSTYLTDDTIAANIAFGIPPEQINLERVHRAAELAHLNSWIAELPNGLDTLVGERGVAISGGQKQRIGIARALYHAPEILILDEATSALDSETEHGILTELMALRGQSTVIFVTHRKGLLEYCDQVYEFRDGRITKVSHTIPNSDT